MIDFALGAAFGFFALSWWWMAIFSSFFVAGVICVHKEEYAPYSFCLAVLYVIHSWVVGDNWWAPVTNITNDFGGFLFGVFQYFFVGLTWSVGKWYFYTLAIRDKVRNGEWKDLRFSESKNTKGTNYRPRASYASENKERIMGWIAFWPLSVIDTLLGDWLYRVTQFLYHRLINVYNAVDNLVWNDMPDEPENPNDPAK